MHKKPVPALLSVIACGGLLLMALVCFFTMNPALAWFSQNASVSAGGMSVSVGEDPFEKVSLVARPVRDIADHTYEVVKTETEYTLPVNDPNGISYSEYKQALAVFITVTCIQPAEISVYLTTSTADVSIAENNFISNCVELAPAAWDEGTGLATVSGDFKSLVTVADNTCTKATSVLLQSASIPEGTTTLCFVMRYNEAFLDYANAQVLANGSNYLQLNYTNDITFSIQ